MACALYFKEELGSTF